MLASQQRTFLNMPSYTQQIVAAVQAVVQAAAQAVVVQAVVVQAVVVQAEAVKKAVVMRTVVLKKAVVEIMTTQTAEAEVIHR